MLTADQGWLAERNEIYRERRDLILSALPEVGMTADTPEASLYVWAKVPEGYRSAGFVAYLLEEAGISLTPGDVFGPHGEGYVRISLGMSTERIREAIDRLRRLAS